MYLFKLLSLSRKASTIIVRECSDFPSRVYSAPKQGILNILLPFQITIKPLDPVQFPDGDKVIINCEGPVECSRVNDSLNISSTTADYDSKISCEILAPMQSSINASCHGNITISNFLGEAIRLYSEYGNVILGHCKNDYITATTKTGNIVTEGTVDAVKVDLRSIQSGNINANNMKCLGLKIETNTGNVNLESSYCDESFFVTKTGSLVLKNVHKHCKIVLEKDGNLNMIGFNGILDVRMQKGKADVQISELKDKSYINMSERCQLVLQLSNKVLENTEVQVFSKCCGVEDNIVHQEDIDADLVRIIPKNVGHVSKLTVRAPDTIVTVKQASWKDMIEKAFKKTTGSTI